MPMVKITESLKEKEYTLGRILLKIRSIYTARVSGCRKRLEEKFMNIRKLLCSGIAALMCCSLISGSIHAQEVSVMEQQAQEVVAGDYVRAGDFNIKNGVLVRYYGNDEDVVIPDGVTSIGEGAFMDCFSLASITIPEGVTSIGEDAFNFCESLTDITIPKSVTSIGYGAFSNCSSLTDITIPERVTKIYDCTFLYCSSLVNITIPERVTSIGERAFSNCSSLTSIIIPKNVTSIGYGAFRECTSLTDITIPERVTSIGESAFDGCSSLISVTIPKSVTSIGKRAFRECSENLILHVKKGSYAERYASENNVWFVNGETSKPIKIKRLTNTNVSISRSSYTYDGKAKKPSIKVQDGRNTFKKGKDYTVTYKNNIKAGTASVTVTGKGNCKGTVTKRFTITIKKNYIHKAGTLKYRVTGTSSVSVIGVSRSNAVKVNIPQTVEIGGKMFEVTAVGKNAFRNNKKITSLTIGGSVKIIEASAFAGCTNLRTVLIGSEVTKIGNSAFWNCKKLDTMIIDTARLKKVGKNAFKGIRVSAKIEVPEKKMSAYKGIFANRAHGNVKLKKGIAVKKIISVDSLTESSSLKLAQGKEAVLITTVTAASDNPEDKKVTYKSSNKKVAVVTKNGVVKGKKPGTAEITVTLEKNKKQKAKVHVTVLKGRVKNVNIRSDSVDLKKGDTVRLVPEIKTSSGGSKDLVWNSNNEDVATVSKDGLIKAVGYGAAYIVATAADGTGKNDYIWVYVKKSRPHYKYEVKFFNPPYSDLENIAYIKTKNPCRNGRIKLVLYNEQDGTVSSNWVESEKNSRYSDLKNMSYKKNGGYFSRIGFLSPGKCKVRVEEYDNKYNLTGYVNLGYIDVKDYQKEKTAWMRSVIKKQTTNSMTKKEKLRAITNYMGEHSVYLKNDGTYLVFIAAEVGIPFWKFAKYEFDSYTSPCLLKEFADMIDYPVDNLYDNYERGTTEWQIYHHMVYSDEDDNYFTFCPATYTNIVDPSKVKQINLSKWKFYNCYK